MAISKMEGESKTMLTATQFIHQAALKTGIIVSPTPWKKPTGKKRKNESETIEVNGFTGIILKNPDYISVPDEQCWLCGGETGGKGQTKKKAIKNTFTNHDLAKNMQSQSICPGCTFCLSYAALRNYSIVATHNELKFPDKDTIRKLLMLPPEPPFVFCIATSGQKWLHFKAPINYSNKKFIVLLEEMPIPVEPIPFSRLLRPVEKLYTTFTKAEILSGDYNQARIKQFGILEWEKLEQEIAIQRGSRLFQLAVHVARKEED